MKATLGDADSAVGNRDCNRVGLAVENEVGGLGDAVPWFTVDVDNVGVWLSDDVDRLPTVCDGVVVIV